MGLSVPGRRTRTATPPRYIIGTPIHGRIKALSSWPAFTNGRRLKSFVKSPLVLKSAFQNHHSLIPRKAAGFRKATVNRRPMYGRTLAGKSESVVLGAFGRLHPYIRPVDAALPLALMVFADRSPNDNSGSGGPGTQSFCPIRDHRPFAITPSSQSQATASAASLRLQRLPIGKRLHAPSTPTRSAPACWRSRRRRRLAACVR